MDAERFSRMKDGVLKVRRIFSGIALTLTIGIPAANTWDVDIIQPGEVQGKTNGR